MLRTYARLVRLVVLPLGVCKGVELISTTPDSSVVSSLIDFIFSAVCCDIAYIPATPLDPTDELLDPLRTVTSVKSLLA